MRFTTSEQGEREDKGVYNGPLLPHFPYYFNLSYLY